MITQSKRYGFIKTFVWDVQTLTLSGVGVLEEQKYWIDFKGVTKLPFYVLDIMFQPWMYLSDGSKHFNMNDPLVFAQMMMFSLNQDIIGDDIAYDIHMGTGVTNVLNSVIRIYPQLHYDFVNNPLLVPNNRLDFTVSYLVDSSFALGGANVKCMHNLILTLGVEMPVQLADGTVIPPPLDEIEPIEP